jgi:hypothetical protein
MKLYNLTYEDKYYVSSIEPTTLPLDNYCFVEIDYLNESIKGIKGSYFLNGEIKECVLSDLIITPYIEKLKTFLNREDIDKDKIHLNFVENLSDENERILKIFIILISSYLIYFNFLQFPYIISLDLLNNSKFKHFTSFSYTNNLQKCFVEQVSYLHRYFSDIFDDVHLEEIFHEIRDYKKRLILDIDKKIGPFQKDIEDIKELKKKLEGIFKDF